MLGSTYLHGHLHSYKDYNQEQRSNRILRYDALVDANNYYPVLLDDILDFFNRQIQTKWKMEHFSE